LTSRLVINADDHKPLLGDRVDEVLALHNDRIDGMGNGGEERGQKRERANWLSNVSQLRCMVVAQIWCVKTSIFGTYRKHCSECAFN